jgi:hypothetical protein
MMVQVLQEVLMSINSIQKPRIDPGCPGLQACVCVCVRACVNGRILAGKGKPMY